MYLTAEDGDVDPEIVQTRQVIIFMPLIAPDLLVGLSCAQRLSRSQGINQLIIEPFLKGITFSSEMAIMTYLEDASIW